MIDTRQTQLRLADGCGLDVYESGPQGGAVLQFHAAHCRTRRRGAVEAWLSPRSARFAG